MAEEEKGKSKIRCEGSPSHPPSPPGPPVPLRILSAFRSDLERYVLQKVSVAATIPKHHQSPENFKVADVLGMRSRHETRF